MYQKERLRQSYMSACGNIYLAAACSFVNSLLSLTGSNVLFLFSLFLPYRATLASRSGFLGLSGFACFFAYAVIPALVYGILGVLAQKGRYWALPAAAAILLLDFIFLAAFSYRTGNLLITLILCHIWMLFIQIKGAIAAIRLMKGDFTDELPADDLKYPVRTDNSYPFGAAAYQNDPDTVSFGFDPAYARQNGAIKQMQIAAVMLGYFLGCGSVFLLIFLLWQKLDLSDGFLFGFMGAGMIVCTGIFIFLMVRLSPYIEQRLARFSVRDGLLSMDKADLPPFNHIDLNDLSILEEEPDHWKVGYTNRNGKAKTMVIPKSFPGLDEFLRSRK